MFQGGIRIYDYGERLDEDGFDSRDLDTESNEYRL